MQISLIYCFVLVCLTCKCSGWFHIANEYESLRNYSIADELPERLCQSLGLHKKQTKLCAKNVAYMPVVAHGAKVSLEQCQKQFAGRLWNCQTASTVEKANIYSLRGNSSAKVYPYTGLFSLMITERGTREVAFIHGMFSAGLIASVNEACQRGDLPRCSCLSKTKNQLDEFASTGCKENILKVQKFVNDFIDVVEKHKINKLSNSKKHQRKAMNVHNNHAGYYAVEGSIVEKCKCIGVSGSCTSKDCWNQLDDFGSVGDWLEKKYEGAVQIKFENDGSKSNFEENYMPPTKEDLVYLEHSPDYCEHRPEYGWTGTHKRECDDESMGPDGCNILCCGNGKSTTITTEVENCNCSFVYCCTVECDTCEVIKKQSACL